MGRYQIAMGSTVAIIQARMGSSRLPGKMMMELSGIPIIEWVIRRVQGAALLDDIVVATSEAAIDDELALVAKNLGVKVFRGSETDVLDRFVKAVEYSEADAIVRICADNPLIDPGEIDRLIQDFNNGGADYVCNHQDRLGSGYADGFGAEIFKFSLLKSINKIELSQLYREHVTLYFWDHADQISLRSLQAPKALDFPKLKFDVDTFEDFCALETLIKNGVSITSKAEEIIKITVELKD
jgi:spore coat polysaccharide biosynthesis protein SpsF